MNNTTCFRQSTEDYVLERLRKNTDLLNKLYIQTIQYENRKALFKAVEERYRGIYGRKYSNVL